VKSAQDVEAKRIYEMEKPLSERLKVARTEAFDPLPPQLLRKVGIDTTKNCCFPQNSCCCSVVAVFHVSS